MVGGLSSVRSACDMIAEGEIKTNNEPRLDPKQKTSLFSPGQKPQGFTQSFDKSKPFREK